MRRYYFHVRSVLGLIHDPEGEELADLDAVRRQCIAGIRKIIADEAAHGFIDLTSAIEVDDEGGAPVLTVRFDEAVTVTLPA